MDTPELAAAVSAALREAGVAQRTAAAKSGIPLTTLTRRLTGRSPFTVTELVALAELAGVRPSELLARAEDAAAVPA